MYLHHAHCILLLIMYVWLPLMFTVHAVGSLVHPGTAKMQVLTEALQLQTSSEAWLAFIAVRAPPMMPHGGVNCITHLLTR
jgi:lysylphosphatidylglycerol synthetase-like protein (DUF2156 family)